MSNWCICNNSGQIFVEKQKGSQLYFYERCPICSNLLSFNDLIKKICYFSFKQESIKKIYMNSDQMEEIIKYINIGESAHILNEFYGIPIILDEKVNGIKFDFYEKT